jgi:hypothetical protein
VMADPLVEVAVRVYADFADHVTVADVLAVIDRCRIDPGTSSAALLELVERLARQRLADRLERLAPDARVRPPAHRVPQARPGLGRCSYGVSRRGSKIGSSDCFTGWRAL